MGESCPSPARDREARAGIPETAVSLAIKSAGEAASAPWPPDLYPFPDDDGRFSPGAGKPKSRAGTLFPAACFSLSLAGHILLIALLVAWASGQAPMSAFEPAPGSPFLEATLIETALLGGGQADHPEADEDGPEPDESPLPPPLAPEAPDWPQAFDLKAPEPETAPEPRPKPPPKPQTAAKRPKTAAQASPSSKKAGHSGPGHPLGSPQGNSAAGGGGAGGLGQSGAVGWQAVRVPQPLYPPLSQQNGEQGRVVAAVVVSPSGRVSSASIVRSSGYARLDQAALSAARHISFRAKSGGAPRSAVTVEVPYRFKIRY